MKSELKEYCFDCSECLYSAVAYEPIFPIEKSFYHTLETKHTKGKFRVIPKGLCLIDLTENQ